MYQKKNHPYEVRAFRVHNREALLAWNDTQKPQILRLSQPNEGAAEYWLQHHGPGAEVLPEALDYDRLICCAPELLQNPAYQGKHILPECVGRLRMALYGRVLLVVGENTRPNKSEIHRLNSFKGRCDALYRQDTRHPYRLLHEWIWCWTPKQLSPYMRLLSQRSHQAVIDFSQVLGR